MKGGSPMIITIGRTCGSGGDEIAQRLAQRLDIPLHVADLQTLSEPERLEAIVHWAQQGACVIVGFCADHVLAGTPGLIRVFLHSTLERRVARLVKEQKLSAENARRWLLSQDREQAMVYGFHTKAKWTDASRYDLVVDCGPLGTAGTVELLCQFVALKVMKNRPGGGSYG